MKKPYQIESQRAVRQLEEMAADGNPAVQMVLPMAEMVGWLRHGVGELIRQAGLQRSPGVGGRAQSTTGGAQGQPVGHGARLLCGDGTEGADQAAACAVLSEEQILRDERCST